MITNNLGKWYRDMIEIIGCIRRRQKQSSSSLRVNCDDLVDQQGLTESGLHAPDDITRYTE